MLIAVCPIVSYAGSNANETGIKYLGLDAPSAGGALIFGIVGDIRALDPGVIQDKHTALITSNIFENLVKFDRDSFRILPSLAKHWKIENNRVFIFYLRKNVKFHDGTSFDAFSIKYNIDRQMDPRHPFHYPNYGRFLTFDSIFGGFHESIEKVEVLDPYTLKITLKTPNTSFLGEMALYQFGIVSPTALKKMKDGFYECPVGTGPFRFLEWRKPNRIVLISNREYWGNKPYLDRLIFESYSDLTACLRQLERGQIDFMNDIPFSSLEELKKNPNIETLQISNLNLCYIAINCQRFPFNQKDLRIALNHLINRQEIIDAIYSGKAIIADSIIPPGMIGYSKKRNYTFNPKMASKYLKTCRLKTTSSYTLLYPDISPSYSGEQDEMAVKICQYLRKAGLKFLPKKAGYGEFTRKLHYGEYDIALYGTINENGDPDTFLTPAWDPHNARQGSTNICFYINKKIHSLLVFGRSADNNARKAKIYREVEEIISADMPMIPILYSNQVFASNKNIRGLYSHPSGIFDLSQAYLEK